MDKELPIPIGSQLNKKHDLEICKQVCHRSQNQQQVKIKLGVIQDYNTVHGSHVSIPESLNHHWLLR